MTSVILTDGGIGQEFVCRCEVGPSHIEALRDRLPSAVHTFSGVAHA